MEVSASIYPKCCRAARIPEMYESSVRGMRVGVASSHDGLVVGVWVGWVLVCDGAELEEFIPSRGVSADCRVEVAVVSDLAHALCIVFMSAGGMST